MTETSQIDEGRNMMRKIGNDLYNRNDPTSRSYKQQKETPCTFIRRTGSGTRFVWVEEDDENL